MAFAPTQTPPAFAFRCPSAGNDNLAYVSAPAEPGPWPAVVLMDGDYTFDAAVAAYGELRAAGAIPPLLIAALGYGKPFGSPENHRGRDYTPDAAPEEPSSGGADRFLGCVIEGFWPELARRFPVRDDARAIAGHSLGGLFAIHALFQAEPFFTRGLVGAPSIWWAGRAFLQRLDRLRDSTEELPARLFLGWVAEETPSTKEDVALLQAQLARRPFQGLELAPVVFPGRDHYNVVPDLFRAGLKDLFGGGRLG